jgi:VanZ family protein
MFAFLTKHRPGYWPALVWFILCTILLCLPGSRFPKYNWLSEIQFDKWVHIGLFGILVLLSCWGFWSRKKAGASLERPILLLALFATGYGIWMEYIQVWYVPNRSFDVGDIAADAIGSFLGGWFAHGRFHKK